jgi:predicted acylesterase/phospholipase RssA
MAKTSPKTTKVKKVKVAVAIQGGGMHGAFAVGVLTEILTAYDQKKFDLVGLSGTSSGALSALMVWYGLAPKVRGDSSPQAAIDQLNKTWENFVEPSYIPGVLGRRERDATAWNKSESFRIQSVRRWLRRPLRLPAEARHT